MSYYAEKKKGASLKGPGLCHVVYGQGVGKTSRCVGLAVRAAGAGLKVFWVQFMKGPSSSETKSFARLDNITYHCPGPHPFIMEQGPAQVHLDHAQNALAAAHKAVEQGAQLLVCDEILNTLLFKVLDLKDVLGLMELCRGKVELALSGVDAPPEIIEKADYVTELVQKKHPYYQGQEARKGIES